MAKKDITGQAGNDFDVDIDDPIINTQIREQLALLGENPKRIRERELRAILLKHINESRFELNKDSIKANSEESELKTMATGGSTQEKESKPPEGKPVAPQAETGVLAVEIKNHDGDPVKNATVTVSSLGSKKTDDKGFADFGQVKPGTYQVRASKKEYSPKKGGKEGPAETSEKVEATKTNVVRLKLHGAPIIKKENLILVGSELYYTSFWWKMMFIAPAYAMVKRSIKIRQADVTTIAYVKDDYTNFELLPFESLKNSMGCQLKVIGSANDIIKFMEERPEKKVEDRIEKTLLQDVAIFCHGFPNLFSFNLNSWGSNYELYISNFQKLSPEIFAPGGKIYSYACRTGIAVKGEKFKNDAEAQPENSLAQKLADHFKVDVYAYLTRTLFRELIRDPSKSKYISETVKNARKTQEGKIIQIPPDHEALPHPGLNYTISRGLEKEGVHDYALWRKEGAIKMPYAANSPEGLSKSMRHFKPK